ncbi:MAG: DUF1624 domain-containing protein [Ignavibacteriae bacterium]|nr:DUF1624 domain-containing protein [Ignavibacteriota bacterium]
MMKQSNRILFLDYMRGFAVIFMVMGHSIDSVLARDVRVTDGFILYDAIRGFTAPIFLFVSGFAFTITTERRWSEFRTFSKATGKRLLKTVALFLIGYALHAPFFSLEKILKETTPALLEQFFQVDVLHCVGASLLMLQLMLFAIPSRRVFATIVGGLASAIVLASPIVWNIDFAPIVGSFFSPYFNQTQTSIFPLFPFACFLFTGVVMGHFYLEAKEKGQENRFVKSMLVLAVVVVALGIDFDLLPISIYPHHDYWKSSPSWFLVRIGIVTLVCAALNFVKRLPDFAHRNLVTLGQSTLLIYPIHLMIVYGSAANYGLMQRIGQTLAAHQAALIGVAVLVSMLMLTYLWNYLRKNYFVPARLIQAGLASTLLYNFLTRPW